MAKVVHKTMHDLFHETLKDIYFAEKHILRALPKMAKGAHSDKLREAFITHRDETEGQIERLDQVFELIGKPARGKSCEAILGLLEEGKEVMEDFAGDPALDPGLLSAAQAVEHYEISRYGTLKNWAKQLGIDEAVPLIDMTLQQEKNADNLLSKLASAKINLEAA
jgi:ferritin-like metal-binding protein YciE